MLLFGNAFNNIINSLVNNIITPFLGIFTNKVDLSTLFIALNGKHYSSMQNAKDAGAIIINYGSFINAIINFFVISFSMFIVFKYISKVRLRSENNENEEKEATSKKCVYCQKSIPINAIKCPYCTSDLEITE